MKPLQITSMQNLLHFLFPSFALYQRWLKELTVAASSANSLTVAVANLPLCLLKYYERNCAAMTQVTVHECWTFCPQRTQMCTWSHVQWRCKLLNGKTMRRSGTWSARSTSLGMHWSVWVMRWECRLLEKCSWYWRARLSGSAAKQLILGGFCHCCFCTSCDSALLLFCSIS